MKDRISGIIIWGEDYDWLANVVGQKLEAEPPAI